VIGYIVAGLSVALVVAFGLIGSYQNKIKEQSAEIDRRDKRIAQLYKQNAEVTETLERLKSIERTRRKKNAEIDALGDDDVADYINDILSDDD